MNVLDQTVQVETHDIGEREPWCHGNIAGRLCGQHIPWGRKPDAFMLKETPHGWKTIPLYICDKCHRWHGRIDRPELAENLLKEKA